MLGRRLCIGSALIAALVALFALDAWLGETAPVLWVLAVLLALRSVWELRQLLAARFSPNLPLVWACVVAVVSASWIWPLIPRAPALGDPAARLGPPLVAFALALMVIFAAALARYRGPGNNLEILGAEVFILSYVGVFLTFTVQLRWVSPVMPGYVPLASLVVAVKCG